MWGYGLKTLSGCFVSPRNNLGEFTTISALAIGSLGSELLHAAVFEPEIKNICLIRSFISYSDIASTWLYNPKFIPFTVPGAIGEYDLPDLIASICPRNVFLLEPLSGDGSLADDQIVKTSMLYPLKVYSEKKVPGNIELVTHLDHQTLSGQVLKWLKKVGTE